MSNTSISPTAVAQQAEPVALAVPATTNRYGLDTPYLVRWLNRVVPALENYTPAEFAREFGRMAAAADKEALLADQLPAAAQAQQAECGSCDGFNSGCEECCGLGKDGHLAALRQLANVSHRVAHAMGMPAGFDVTTLPDVVVQRLAAAPQAAVPVINGLLSDMDMESLRRFAECCEDPDADGHDVPKYKMKRLELAGAVRSLGFGRHEVTLFGDALLAAAPDSAQKGGA